MVLKLLRDERGDWPGWLTVLLVSVLGGMAILFGVLSGGRNIGGRITKDFESMQTAGQQVTSTTTGLTVTQSTGTGAAITATGN